MAVTVDQKITRVAMESFVALANTKNLPHGPFVLAYDIGNGTLVVPKTNFVDRGAYSAVTTYSYLDMVSYNGYQHVVNDEGGLAGVAPMDLTGSAGSNPNYGKQNAGWGMPSLSMLNFIRAETNTYVNGSPSSHPVPSVFEQSVSGPWPCQNPDLNYDDLALYFADTGSPESVTISNGGNQAFGKVTFFETGLFLQLGYPFDFSFPATEVDNDDGTADVTAAITPAFRYRCIKSVEFQFVVGGTEPVQITGYFQCGTTAGGADACVVVRGTSFTQLPHTFPSIAGYDATDPTSLIDIDDSEWIPGVSFAVTVGGWYGRYFGDTALVLAGLQIKAEIDAVVDPGTYKVKISFNGDSNVRSSGTIHYANTGDYADDTGSNNWAWDTFVSISPSMFAGVTTSLVNTEMVAVSGIHDTKQIYKIECPKFNSGVPFGVWAMENWYAADQTITAADTVTPPPFYLPYMNLVSGPLIEIAEDADPFTDPTVAFTRYHQPGSPSISATVDGFWIGKTPPVNSLAMLVHDKMPWNTFPIGAGSLTGNDPVANFYLGFQTPYRYGHTSGQDAEPAYADIGANIFTPPWERQDNPPKWKARAFYPLGFQIEDANGNWQAITRAGRTDTTEPSWTTGLNDVTTEADYHGVSGRVDVGAIWKLTKKFPTKFGPATAQRFSAPRYPFFWNNPVTNWSALTDRALGETCTDANGNLQQVIGGGKTGAPAPAWNNAYAGATTDGTVTWKNIRVEKKPLANGVSNYNFAPHGWWIYRVSLHRHGVGVKLPEGPEVSVDLGCIRNGVFTSFGTYTTGTVVDAMWPVFTRFSSGKPLSADDHLAYECAERVDVQAEIITCGLSYAMWGNVTYPLAAAFLNDVEAILNLLP